MMWNSPKDYSFKLSGLSQPNYQFQIRSLLLIGIKRHGHDSSSPRTARRSPDQWRHLADSPHATFLFAGGFNAIITFWWVRVMVSLVVSVGVSVRVRVSKLLGSD